jgi:OOP family OmpA-OmpF porin
MGAGASVANMGARPVGRTHVKGRTMLNHSMQRLRRPKALRCAVIALATAAALPAWAQSSPATGPYVGATVGKPDWKADSVGGLSGDSSGTGLKAYGGWRFTPHLGAELSAVRLGRLSGPLGEAKADGYGLDAVGYLPLSPDWTAFARAGVAQIKTSVPGASDRNSAPKVGLGAQYQFNPRTALRGEWERYRLDAFGSKSNTDMYSLGVQFSF